MSPKKSKDCYADIRISGMTCPSCEILLERKLKTIPGVQHVDVHHRKGMARITARADTLPSEQLIASVVQKAGYSIGDDTTAPSSVRPHQRKWMEIGGSLLIIYALYRILQVFDLVSLAPSTSGALSTGGILLIGLVAGTSSCLAVTGGLLLALAARHNELHGSETPWQKFAPLLHFNVGRLASYFLLGGLVGILGQSISPGPRVSGYMSVVVAFIMLYLAFAILEIVPRGSFPLKPPKKLARWIDSLSESDHPAAPFTAGALTFFLPCGFTQSLQLAALASGSFLDGAVMMFVFALGTLPALIGISAISSTASGTFSRVFLRFSGTLVLVLALFNLQSGFALSGIDLSRAFARNTQQQGIIAPVQNGGVQEISMTVTRYGYSPEHITIRAGVPVRWSIDGTQASGCTSVMTIPSLGISQALRSGENVIEFTAPQTGQLAFMCSMGMVRGTFTVI